jgi:hypothetical protein
MSETRISANLIVESQLPNFVKEEFPLVSEFLSQYYKSLEYQSGVSDILQNIDQYVKVDQLANLTDSTVLTQSVEFLDDTINVSSTYGFPDHYGLILIDNEIITYTEKTSTAFVGCVRGFSGVTSYQNQSNKDELVFSTSEIEEHLENSKVTNLSVLFLKEFFNKLKKQITPGFENRELFSILNDGLFVKQAKDFYASKGTDNSFKILFGALYGKNVDVIKPRDYLFEPSDAQYRITRDLVVEVVEGDPNLLENKTLYQDADENFTKAEGTISKVEKIVRGTKEYYVISLDYDYDRDIQVSGSVLGSFSIHPKTILITPANIGDTTLDVDSTVGFPSSGTLLVSLDNGTNFTIEYASKTINQFLDCSGISQSIPSSQEISLDSYAYGYSDNLSQNIVKVRILGVLSDINVSDQNPYYDQGDFVFIKSLGNNLEDYKSNNWFFNVSTRFDVESVQLLDSSDFTYRVNLYDNHNFSIGDNLVLISSSGEQFLTNIVSENVALLNQSILISFQNRKSFNIQGQGQINTNLFFSVRKILSKVDSLNFTYLKQYTSNVQNVYDDLNGSIYVASPSLPTYLNQQLNINDRSITFSGSFSGTLLTIGSHKLYTGDSIVYNPSNENNRLDLPNGIYFVSRVDSVTIQLARSKENIFTGKFIEVNGTVTNNKFQLTNFTYSNLENKLVEPQKLLRKISNSENDSIFYQTEPGPTGIFVNGVEILNYKSNDEIYFGEIENISVTAPGSGYDVINPPILTITDDIGSGASAHCSVLGSLKRVDIIDPGFDYLEDPIITISGGNGSGAIIKPNLTDFNHFAEFNSSVSAGLVNFSNNTIGFSSHHKFRDAEKVIYQTQSQTNVGGLSNASFYYVSVQDAFTVKVHKTFNDAAVGINTIDLTSYGVGNHRFLSVNKKKKLTSVVIVDSGSNYQNKKVTTTSSGINTATNSILIPNHGYQSGEIINYTPNGVAVGGLSTSSYYVTKISDDEFKLSPIGFGTVGVGTEVSSFYYDTKQYVDLTSVGSGDHGFNYPPITISIKGNIGVSTLTGQNYSAILQPIIRGSIQSVFVESGGSSYGSEGILNYNRQPQFNLQNGLGAQLSPIISNGRISEVLVKNGGSGYNSPPNLIISGSGNGAILSPIVVGGVLIEVKVISGGIGYSPSDTLILVESPGSESKFEASIKSWRVNNIERLILENQIPLDDGIIGESINPEYGLQYYHSYAPRSLRRSVLASKFIDGDVRFVPDLQIFSGKEFTSDSHSPIIGWAYDGNPIYGPYGYSSPTGGSVRCLKSGYTPTLKIGRPNTSIYPFGFFVEDYEFNNSGDLDIHNGRFSITPEYPNGIYAYFCTIDPVNIDSVGSFENYRRPIFPYVIGNEYKSKPNTFNFLKSSNQDEININETGWLRNTTPYNATKSRSYYDYLANPDNVKKQVSVIQNTTRGVIDSVGIITGGESYQINDSIIFSNDGTGGSGVIANVSEIKGKTISQISVASSTVSNIEFIPINNINALLGFATSPHGLSTNDVVTFSSLYASKQSSKVSVFSNKLNLVVGVGSTGYTGLVTYFNVSGSLSYPTIRENDIYQILNEQVKILSIDPVSSRILVLRNQNETLGISSYSAGIGLTEVSRKFEINVGLSTSYDFNVNRQIYFDPSESVGLGTTSGVGVGYTLFFTNPGAGITQINIPTRSIYLPNHNILTGTELIYSTNGSTAVSVSTDGVSSFSLTNNQIVYVAKISSDLIGISTIKVGLGTEGSFVGIGSTFASLLYFTNVGTGNIHSFETNYSNILEGEVSKNLVTVSTASTHGLLTDDVVDINVISGLTTTVIVKYNDYNRRIVINPRNFEALDINLQTDTIIIPNHQYITGQKVIHTSTSPSGGLVNENIYYVIVVDSNKIKLSDTFYGATKQNPDIVGITTTSFGTISPINPFIKLTKNNTLVFDVSDPSLSFVQSGTSYPAFELNFYKDSQYLDKFESTETTTTFNVIKSGVVGIDSAAKVALRIDQNVPDILYYKVNPIDLENNTLVKKEIIIDADITGHNEIGLVESVYNGKYQIFENSSNSFTYTVSDIPEQSQYNSVNGFIQYTTTSPSAYGSISSVSIKSKGRNYKKLPQISSIKSTFGKNAILNVNSSSIGSISTSRQIDIQDIGFNYSADLSVRPVAEFPNILKIENLSSFKSIGISSFGRNYILAPDLIVLDGITGEVISDVDLKYTLGNRQVEILQNTKGLSNAIPTILPINNINGVGISTIRFESNKDVVVTLGSSFSNASDFPFNIGDKVLIEGISVGTATTLKGFNSSNYNYALFTIVNTDPNIGGVGATVSYNLASYLAPGEIPGTYDPINSVGRIIPEKHFPIFNIQLQQNKFNIGESVFSNSSIGIVQNWDDTNSNLKVATNKKFEENQLLIGQSSKTQAVIQSVTAKNSDYNVQSSSIVRKGWNRETGFLNNDLQRLHDNDYYQYFSYSLKSEIELNSWNEPVSSLNHVVGFKKFGDLLIENDIVGIGTTTTKYTGISTSQDNGDFVAIINYDQNISLNCVYDFDLALEKTVTIGSNIGSNEIILNSQIVQDYLESVGNRVLMIDDISSDFNSNPRPTPFSIVGTFDLSNFRYKKYITCAFDTFFTDQKQILLVSLLHDGSNGYINQYGRVETIVDLGSYDFTIKGSEGQLLFYPVYSELNNYDVSLSSYGISDFSGIGTCNLGTVATVQSSNILVPSGTSTATTIVGIASTYRAFKVLVQIGSTVASYFEVDELTVIHDGTNVELLEYGQLTTDNLTSFASSGIGTYDAYISGSNINIDLTPSLALSDDYTVNTIFVAIGNSSAVGVGTSSFIDSQISSSYVSIASSSSPTATVVASLNTDLYDSAYYIACVEDTTNNRYQVSELISINNGSTYYAEFGNVYTDSSLGEFSTNISGELFSLEFTPIADIDCEVRVYQHGTGHLHDLSLPAEINLNNANIFGEFGSYEGTNIDIKKSFNLTHKQLPIFERYITGNDSEIVDLTLNAFKIPNHYFVTGEKLIYSYDGDGVGTGNAIGIDTTTISGIGLTDKLPKEIYAVKVNDLYVRVSASASEALQTIPSVLTLSSVGIGTSHILRSTNQNAKGIISIDNVIQSPIVSTAITAQLLNNIEITDIFINFAGITSFFGGDLIKINNEIMKIDSIGVGSTNNVLVRRGFMGTGISTHAQNDLVFKVLGNYNIVNNLIHFAQAPYGKIPFTNPSNRSDEQDYVGLIVGSTFSGRIFTKSGFPNSANDSYFNNYIIDDISSNFDGDDQTFTLQSNLQNISGISTSNAIVLLNQIFQGPARNTAVNVEGDYLLSEQSGITSITFTGSGISTNYDVNTSSVPRGGILVSVGSTKGFGYQPLVSAGGTAIVSTAGTIASISIGNSGSGYREGVQTIVNVGVYTGTTEIANIEFIGIASISGGNIVSVAITNPGFGYTSTNPPVVVFDSPLSYSNLPLIYSSSSTSGMGTGAIIDIVVGQGSSIIGFEIINSGYSYRQGEILTVETGGLSGIPTNSSLEFNEFQIYVDKTQTDSFSAWTIGDLQVLDPIDSLFDGKTKTFPLRINGLQTTIRTKKGSNIDIQATLLVFINDILQVPENGYIFNGGSTITFPEPPKPGDLSKIIFYKGNGDIDVISVDILETIKQGDTVQLYDDSIRLTENERLVTQINSTDIVQTNLYFNPGLTQDETYLRPLIWCRQTEDKIINGIEVGKDRIWYEPSIQPTTNLIQNVGINTDTFFVESVKTFFDHYSEYDSSSNLPKKIIVTSQDLFATGIATAVVSAAGTISLIVISNGGSGYTTTPTITIANPIGIGTTAATATATVTSGSVSSINISYAGFGYTTTNPPSVLIESPTPSTEIITNATYEGDFGIITGIQTTSVGVASTGIVFNLFIPVDSFIRDTYVNSVGIATTGISGIQTGYYFVVSNSNIGYGVTSLRQDGSVVGFGNTFLDNIYEVSAVSIAQTSVPGVGLTYVAQVTVSIEDYNGLTGLGFSNFYGEYSWGRLSGLTRSNPQTFAIYNFGLSGINTSPVVQRVTPLKYLNYNT